MQPLLFLAALAAQAATPLPPADSADGRCIVVAGYVGAHGAPEQANASRSMVIYFVGRLTGRTPGAPVAAIIARSAEQAQATHLNAQAEAQRCQAEFNAGTAGLMGVRTAAGLPPEAAAPTPRKP